MKKDWKFIILAIVAAVLWACSGSNSKNKENTTAQSPSYHQQALRTQANGGAPEEYIALQKKAIEEMRQGKTKETSVEILSQMGFFYFRSGDYLQALTYLQEAADSMRNMPPDKIDIETGVKLLGNTSNLYTRISLYDEALALNTQALELCKQGDNTRVPDLWRMRSMVYEMRNNLDSAIICSRNALKASYEMTNKELKDISIWQNKKSYAGLFIEHPEYKPDSIAMAIAILEREKTIDRQDPTQQFLIGRGYYLLGNTTKGLKIMESALQIFREKYGTDDIEWALNLYSKSIVEKELSPQSLKIYNEARMLSDTVAEYSKANALLGADFKYRTTQIENDKKLLESQLELEHERTLWRSTLGLIAIILIITFSIMRVRHKNKIISNNKESINRLIEERIKLNTEIENFNQNECKNKYGIKDNNASTYSEILTMALLTKEDDIHFRQLFDSIFPGYIQRIRRDYPDITPTAELICMLIRLNKSNEDISLTLGIKRESVLKSRYRLRTLFKLDKETELNDFIASL